MNAVATSGGGRTTYRNVGQALRRALEVDLDAPLSHNWKVRTAYTRLDARLTEFDGCSKAC
jgi:iron complex outermembrane receptor protein